MAQMVATPGNQESFSALASYLVPGYEVKWLAQKTPPAVSGLTDKPSDPVELRNSPAIYWKGLAFLIGIKMRG
jgi:hypothetical protein